jgi:hypothetical protein
VGRREGAARDQGLRRRRIAQVGVLGVFVFLVLFIFIFTRGVGAVVFRPCDVFALEFGTVVVQALLGLARDQVAAVRRPAASSAARNGHRTLRQ